MNAAQGRTPKRNEKHDKALTSAEKKIAAQDAKRGKQGGSFLGSKMRRIWKDNT